ncbi:hypothetical protein Tco_1367996 [Tanacetum coccineum]
MTERHRIRRRRVVTWDSLEVGLCVFARSTAYVRHVSASYLSRRVTYEMYEGYHACSISMLEWVKGCVCSLRFSRSDGVALSRLVAKLLNFYGFFGSLNLTADPDAVSMIQTASHLSPDAVGDIQTASPKPGLESSSIFTLVSYLVCCFPN